MDPSPSPYAPPQNVYAPPAAPAPAFGLPASGEPPFYVVSPAKFVVLSLGTVGFYEIYWFYKNWKRYKLFSGDDVWPVPRAIFAIFFTHSLFRKVDEKLRREGRAYPWSPETCATGYVLLAIAGRVLDRLASKFVGSPLTDFASLGALGLGIVVLLQAQRAINAAAGDPEGAGNSSFGAGNIVALALGLLIWALILFGIFAESVPV